MASKAASPQEKTVKKSRDKAASFVELAQKRVTRALEAIDRVKALSNRRSYTYTPDQVEKIGTALKTAVVKCGESFNTTAEVKEGFKL